MADNVAVRARCASCGSGLGFEEWSKGLDQCPTCAQRAMSQPAGYVPGAEAAPAPQQPFDAKSEEFKPDEFARLLDELPDELVDELATALEAAAMPEIPPDDESAVSGFFSEVEFGSDPRESHWAAWGFSTGFVLNVLIAKFAQMSTGAPMAELMVPIIAGGVIAGGAGAAVGWGLAKLREG